MISDTISNKQDSILDTILRRFNEIDSTNQIITENYNEISDSINNINNSINNNNDIQLLWTGAIIGAILGLFLSLLATWIAQRIKYQRFNKTYSKYSGIYLAVKKYDQENKKVFRCFELKQYRNTFTIENGISVLGNEDYHSVITMNENNLNHGTGHYQHNIGPEGTVKFGFLEIQLATGEILVHETVYNKEGEQNSDAFRWVKQESSQRDEILHKYREIQMHERNRKFGKFLNEK